MGTRREAENFREELRRQVRNDLFTDARVMSDASLARCVDAEAITKCRLSRYGMEKNCIKRSVERGPDGEDMERLRSYKGDYRPGPVEFALSDNLAEIYFKAYGHGFPVSVPIKGSHERRITYMPFISKDENWVCPHCGIKYGMLAKLLPEHCYYCGNITPYGELVRDKVLRR